MATLHVRNVPDGLYELLREQAAANGRSIGSEAIVLLEGVLPADGRIRSLSLGVPRRRGTTPLDRVGAAARRVIIGAQAAAQELASPAIGTEHLLLALLDEPPIEVAVFVLAAAGIDARLVRAAIGASSAPAAASEPLQAIPFSPGAKRALELALRESIGMRCLGIEPGAPADRDRERGGGAGAGDPGDGRAGGRRDPPQAARADRPSALHDRAQTWVQGRRAHRRCWRMGAAAERARLRRS